MLQILIQLVISPLKPRLIQIRDALIAVHRNIHSDCFERKQQTSVNNHLTQLNLHRQKSAVILERRKSIQDVIVDLLASFDSLRVIGQFKCPTQAERELQRDFNGVIFLSVNNIRKVASTVSRIRGLWPESKLVGFSDYFSYEPASEFMRSGGTGYFTCHDSTDDINNVITESVSGRSQVCSKLANQVVQNWLHCSVGNIFSPMLADLTQREHDIFWFIGHGYAAQEIASRLNLSVKTVETHQVNVCRKLKLPGQREFRKAATKYLLENR